MQSRRMSLIEAVANVGVGYAMAVAAEIGRPMVWAGAQYLREPAIGALLTLISLIRGYAQRMLFVRIAVRTKKKDQPKLVLSRGKFAAEQPQSG